ncbi:MAG: PD40 domain-containing protein [Bacteroidales bacterium]|nr:PD40 domain-containing protein [Bacteroidales bacterium]
MQLKVKIRPLFIFLLLHITMLVPAQYFGRNKPGYKKFDYQVIKTPNFELYHYLNDSSLVNSFVSWAEEWYDMHQVIFRDTFTRRNPLIVYNTHADFQQTNAVTGLIGTGTGGVTEGLKNRVVMPFAKTLYQTDHVLGHELVHAFQFKELLSADTSKNYSVRNLPLWMIEGMAEYLSIGSMDPNTAMWIRDALINDDFPDLEQLTRDPGNYFPYRYGHAFWAMVGKTWGDTIIMPLFEKTAEYQYENAIDSVLGINSKTFSSLWESVSRNYYAEFLRNTSREAVGRKIISSDKAGRINVSPSISPRGKYIAFFSDKDLFTFDVYLAEVKTGKIVKKLAGIVKNNDFDDYNFIESAGTWSPDGRKFAFVVFEKGVNKLAIIDVDKGRITEEITINDVPAFSNPAWSPDGRTIVLTGLVNGRSDLFLYHMDTGKTERLSDDIPGNIHPSWSPDGEYIVYSQEIIHDSPRYRKFSFALAIINTSSGEKKVFNIFKGAKNLNPFFSPDMNSIFFISDADGLRNLYRYDIADSAVYRMTNYATGISGITHISPAISRVHSENIIAYTYYNKKTYHIYLAEDTSFVPVRVPFDTIDMKAGILPPLQTRSEIIIDTNLLLRPPDYQLPRDSIDNVPYKARFRLDYISNSTGLGVTGSQYGGVMQGSINMIFSDIVGNNQLYSSLSLNGEIYDFGGLFSYINQGSRIKWGASVSHIPYRSGYLELVTDTIGLSGDTIPVNNLRLDFIRMFEDNISLFAFYPLSQTRRFEGGVSFSWYYFRWDRFNNYYTDLGMPLYQTREKLDAPEGNNYQQVNMAYVADNSFFGMTSPMQGHRSRFQMTRYFGAVNMYTALIDYRKYFFIKPVSLAFRAYHYGRYGLDKGTDLITPLYLGYPWLIRGYENISFIGNNYSIEESSFNISHLSGSRIAVGNIELRVPLTGPERIAPIKSKYFLTDINLFFDAGLAWNSDSDVSFDWSPETFDERIPIYSAGISARINLLGAIVFEPYLAVPFQNGGFDNISFGFNLFPGW